MSNKDKFGCEKKDTLPGDEELEVAEPWIKDVLLWHDDMLLVEESALLEEESGESEREFKT